MNGLMYKTFYKVAMFHPEEHRVHSILSRPTRELIVFSDVFSKNHWQDPDAVLTTRARHLMLGQSAEFSDEGAPYLLELVCELQDEIRREINKATARSDRAGEHSNVRQAINFKKQAVRVVANSAPRNQDRQNGQDFYLAITDNDVELYVTPLEQLKYVRHRIKYLFHIPTQNHPLFDGEHEQFRSSIIARSCEYPEHLKHIKEDVEKLIPDQEKEAELAYIDKFGNMRIRAKDLEAFNQAMQASCNGTKAIQAKLGDHQNVAHLTSSLKDTPLGSFGLYQNVADHKNGHAPGYLELNKKPKEGELEIPSAHELFGRPSIGTELVFGPYRSSK